MNSQKNQTPRIEYRSMSDLPAWPGNPKDHDLPGIEASIRRFGYVDPVILDAETGRILSGHGRVECLRAMRDAGKIPPHRIQDQDGDWLVPCLVGVEFESEQDAEAYLLAANRLTEKGGWLDAELAAALERLESFDGTGFDAGDLDDLRQKLAALETTEGQTDPDAVPEISETAPAVSETGKIYSLGRHRLACGDCTQIGTLSKLFSGAETALIAADPPYGMGKEKDGVENDNLYREKLDAFQSAWFDVARTFLKRAASVYIWGNEESLFRWFYRSGLADEKDLTFKNEIVWYKSGVTPGQLSGTLRQYVPCSERCLFFMLGPNEYDNNAENYFEGFEPIRAYLDGEKKKLGLSDAKVGEALGVSSRMPGHWFSKSQWEMPTRENYLKLQKLGDAFQRDYEELKRDYEELKRDYYAARATFDNTHEAMTDVWTCDTLRGDVRPDHPTPKPVSIIERILKTSSREGDIVLDPFLGSGTTLIAAEKTGRTCYGVEISPKYCDLIRRRWAEFVHGENCDWQTLTQEARL